MPFLLSILWFIRTSKAILFYFYLWQLKEYHLGRFIDNFRTDKGKRLIFNWLILIKLLILFFLSEGFILWLLLFLYFIESFIFFRNFFQKKFKKPVLTFKTAILITAGLLLEIIFLFVIFSGKNSILFLAYWLLLFDILTPLIASLIVLLFQPLAVLLRGRFILGKARKKIKENQNLVVIGITGSFGKTSTKEFLYAILSQKFNVLKTKEHQNSEAGISLCILQGLKPEHQIFIVEMAAYNRGGIKLLAGIVKPKIGILTGINEQHLALFGSQENIIKTKYELIESLQEDGLAVFNGDNRYCLDLYNKTAIDKKIYRLNQMADIWAEDIVLEKEYVSFKVKTREGEWSDFKLNDLGIHNVSDILGAVIVAKELGMRLDEISRAVSKIKQGEGAMKIIKGKQVYILDSSYSANPDGVIADLDYLKVWDGKKIIVMPCLIELGRASEEVHRRIGRKIGQAVNLAIITTKERFDALKSGAIESGMEEKRILFIEKPEEIINKINNFTSPGDVVLLEGRVPKEVRERLVS